MSDENSLIDQMSPQNQLGPETPEGKERFPVVGIGASAGGLRTLQEFLRNAPADSGVAYVIVTHLAPDYESHLPELLQASTSMRVWQVNRDMRLERNHVYVIPPNQNLSAIDTHLHLAVLEEERRARAY